MDGQRWQSETNPKIELKQNKQTNKQSLSQSLGFEGFHLQVHHELGLSIFGFMYDIIGQFQTPL